MSLLPDCPHPSSTWHTSQGLGTGAWGEGVRENALCLHLNFQGEAELDFPSGRSTRLRPRTMLWIRGANRAVRVPGRERHECLTLIFPDGWLGQNLGGIQSQVPVTYQPLITPPFLRETTQSRVLTAEDRTWAYSLMAPHLCEQARRLLDVARLTDFLVSELFAPVTPEVVTVVSRTERMARERVERAKAELLRQLDEAPSLEVLATTVGCSPHYLSRTFAQVEGLPLSLWLRRARIERASELLASGQCNVSEAALEVGYRSFSHFSRAFTEEKGVQPSKWVEHLGTTAGN